MYHHYDDSRQIEDDHTRLVFNYPYYQQQQHQVLQNFLPLDLSSSTQYRYRYSSSPQHGLHHSYQRPSNFVQTPNHPALQQHRHQFDIQSSSRLTEDNYYDTENVSASTGIPRPAHSSSGYKFQSVSSGFKSTVSGHRMPFDESKMLLQEDGKTVPLGSQNVAGFSRDEQILNSENNDFHFKPGSSTTETTHSYESYGSASSVFRNNADMIRKMKRNPTNSTPESPKLINDGYSRIQQIESYPLSSSESSDDLKPKGGSAASVFRNNAEIMKKIKKRLPSYNLHPNTSSPEKSSHLSQRDEQLKTRTRYHDNDSSRTSGFYSDSDQVNKDHDNGIMSVFDTNLSFVTQVQPPSSPVPSLTESSGVSSGSCDSSFGIKELLMLPSSYRDLSLFQKKYFPTNDYAENKHINVRINHYCDNSTSPKIKTEAKDLDIEVSHSSKESSDSVQDSNAPTSTNILTDMSPTSTVSTIKLEKCNNMNLDKNTGNVCQVCGDKAAGFYCGAFVCEACKKFFMRAAKHGELKKYKCLKDSNCIITKVNRIQCQYCRYQKCVTLKMFCPGDDNDQKKGRTNSNIACQVCGAKSSGFHFGALTCEGCKGFFRRMAKERNPYGYICSKEKKCLVSLSTRNGCKACRYQKCIAVGMSVSCSRIGRQPNAVKHALSLAVKHQKGTPTSTSPRSISSTSSTILSPSSALSPSTVSSTTSPTTVSSTTVSSSSSPSMWLASLSTISSENYIQDSILNLDSKLLISKIKEAGEAFRPINTVGSVTRSEIVGTITDYKKMWKELMKMFISHSKCVINFSKKLPGFRLLDIKTQVLLIQISCYTVILLQLSLNYDVNSKEINFFNLSKEEMKAVMEFFPNFEPVRSHLHHIGTMVQALSLDYTEICLISALLIIDEDNAKLYEREMLGQMQEKISECLRTYEEESYDNGAVRYGVLLLRLGEFSLASLQYGQALVGLETLYPDLEYPQLFTEMMIH